MLAFNFSYQTIAHVSSRINKITSVLLSCPSTGYTGACPFLRGLSTVTHPKLGNSPSAGETTSEAKNLIANSYEDYQYNDQNYVDYHHEQKQQQQRCSKTYANGNKQATIAEESTDYQDKISRMSHDEKVRRVEKEYHRLTRSFRQNLIPHQQTREQQASAYDYDSRLEELIKKKKDDESYRVFRKVRRFSSNFPHGTEQGRPVTIWCSNDYFGMSTHPKVRDAISKALNEFGAGSGGTRNIAGNSPVHEHLEWELADLHNKEAALIFSSCYVANDSTLFTLLKLIPDCHVFSDAGNHASMIQGIRNSGAKKHIFKCFDPVDLEEKLSRLPYETPKIVAFETVHSMTGDISEVGRMCDIAHKYGAITFVDEVHAVGLYGDRGAGIGQRDGCMDKIDIVSGTLGKAYGNCGGYIASSEHLIDVVRSYAAGFIFTTSLPPTVVCGATESVRILKGVEGRYLRDLQQSNVFHMKNALTAAGLPHYPSKSHIIPIPVGNAAKCTQVSTDLLGLGHYIQSINYPTVAKGTERLRVSVTPFHSEQMIDSLIERLVAVWKKNNLNFLPAVEMTSQCRRHQILSQLDSRESHGSWCELCNNEMDTCERLSQAN